MAYATTLAVTAGNLTPTVAGREWPSRDTISGTINLTGSTFAAGGTFQIALTDGNSLLTSLATCTRVHSGQLTFSLDLATTALRDAMRAAIIVTGAGTPKASDYREYWLVLRDTANAVTYIKAKQRVYWVPDVTGMAAPSSISTTRLGDLSDVTNGASVGALLVKASGTAWGPTQVGTAGQVLTSRGSAATPHWTTIAGGGDMTKAVYDPDQDGIIALAQGGTSATGQSSALASLGAAPSAQGVTNGDSHDHAGGDGAQIDHGGLAGLSDADHPDSAIPAPAFHDIAGDISGGQYQLSNASNRRALKYDAGAGSTLELLAPASALGADVIRLDYKTTNAGGFTWTLPAGWLEQGTAPAAAGSYSLLIEYHGVGETYTVRYLEAGS